MSVKFYKSICRHFTPLVRWAYKMEVSGTENIPSEENYPLIVCCNHISMADVVFLGANIPRYMRFLAKSEAAKIPILGFFVRHMDAILIHRGTCDLNAIKTIIKVVSDGGTACVFPQGHRRAGVNPRETEVQPGVGMMVYRSHCNVLPCAIITDGWKMRLFRKSRFVIGKVIPFDELGMTDCKPESCQKAADYIFDKVTQLCNTQ